MKDDGKSGVRGSGEQSRDQLMQPVCVLKVLFCVCVCVTQAEQIPSVAKSLL